jgi:hypothetical protein
MQPAEQERHNQHGGKQQPQPDRAKRKSRSAKNSSGQMKFIRSCTPYTVSAV